MEKSFAQHDENIEKYAVETFKPEDEILLDIRKRIEAAGMPPISVGPMDGLHIEVITRALGAEKAVEVGTLGGYSGVCIARALRPGGKLFTFEISENNAAVARESFAKAGLAEKTEIVLGPAVLNLPRYNRFGPFDLVFIDADKESYPYYLKWAAENLRVGGVVLGDNTFAFGMIADKNIDADDKSSVTALREFNREAAQNGRFRATILPTGEGLTMAVKIK
jgi:caffeoyl-CoA O-methyltransferase